MPGWDWLFQESRSDRLQVVAGLASAQLRGRTTTANAGERRCTEGRAGGTIGQRKGCDERCRGRAARAGGGGDVVGVKGQTLGAMGSKPKFGIDRWGPARESWAVRGRRRSAGEADLVVDPRRCQGGVGWRLRGGYDCWDLVVLSRAGVEQKVVHEVRYLWKMRAAGKQYIECQGESSKPPRSLGTQ